MYMSVCLSVYMSNVCLCVCVCPILARLSPERNAQFCVCVCNCVSECVLDSVCACPLAAEIPVGYNSRLIKGFRTLRLVNDCCVLC